MMGLRYSTFEMSNPLS